MRTQQATFGAGCFWGVEEAFRTLPGVSATAVGYMGGAMENPTYEDVCTNRTGHAEVVQIAYDEEKVSYEKLLGIFWANHNPTTLNAQGPDVGTEYRSVVFFHSTEQEQIAHRSKQMLEESKKWKAPIVTQIVPAVTFYKAEDYHQQYLAKRGMSTCNL